MKGQKNRSGRRNRTRHPVTGWDDQFQQALRLRPRVKFPDTGPPGTRCANPGSDPGLQDFYVLRLPAFWAAGDGEFYGLAFRQAAESAGLDGGEMHKYISIATVTGNKSKSFRVVKPLHDSLFHVIFLCFLDVPAEKIDWFL